MTTAILIHRSDRISHFLYLRLIDKFLLEQVKMRLVLTQGKELELLFVHGLNLDAL